MKPTLIGSFIVFFIIELLSPFTFNAIGDDQVYFYMGYQAAQGRIPYIDFFYAHPPLQLVLYGFFFKFIPYQFHTFKAFFILLTILNAYLLYTIVRRDFDEKIASLSAILYLFSPTILFNASFEYGLTIGMTFFLLGLKCQKNGFKGHFYQVLLFLCAAFYRFHIVFLIGAYYLYIAIRDKKIPAEALAFTNLFFILNMLLVVFVPNYFEDTIMYHLLKPAASSQSFLTASTFLKMNYLVVMLPISLFFIPFKEVNKNLLMYLMIPILYLAYLSRSTLFGYYFVLIVPFLAIISAYAVMSIIRRNNEIKRFMLCFTIGFFLWISASNYASAYAEPMTIEMKGELITGDPSSVAYLALKGNIVMDGGIDHNSMRYESGIGNLSDYIAAIKRNHPVVVVKDEGLYARSEEFRKFLASCTQRLATPEPQIIFKC